MRGKQSGCFSFLFLGPYVPQTWKNPSMWTTESREREERFRRKKINDRWGRTSRPFSPFRCCSRSCHRNPSPFSHLFFSFEGKKKRKTEERCCDSPDAKVCVLKGRPHSPVCCSPFPSVLAPVFTTQYVHSPPLSQLRVHFLFLSSRKHATG